MNLNDFEKDVFEISIEDIPSYGDFISENYIENFLFYQTYKNEYGTEISKYISLSILPYEYFYSSTFTGEIDEFSLKHLIRHHIITPKQRNKKENNIEQCYNGFLARFGKFEITKVNLWCPSLISKVKPAK